MYLFELNLKNGLYHLIQNELDKNWILNNLASTSLFKQEVELILRRKPKGFNLKEKGLLVESGIGFWIEFFNKSLYKQTKGLTIRFTNLPKLVKRKDLYIKMEKIKEMRNLLYHSRIPPVTDTSQINILDNVLNTIKI